MLHTRCNVNPTTVRKKNLIHIVYQLRDYCMMIFVFQPIYFINWQALNFCRTAKSYSKYRVVYYCRRSLHFR